MLAMSDSPSDTRRSLLDAAEALILERGFAGATVDAIVERAGVSKGAFFHHFSSKSKLGSLLLERHGERELRRMQRVLQRAEEVSDDPLIQVLIGLTLMEEELRSPESTGDGGDGFVEGSLLAVVASHPDACDDSTLASARTALAERRSLLSERLEEAARRHPTAGELEPPALARMLEALLEGVRLTAHLDPDAPPALRAADQMGQFRTYLELLFGVPSPSGSGTEHVAGQGAGTGERQG